MHCVNGAAIPVRLALLGARYGLCEPLVSPFAPRKNETFAERKATNFAKAISDDPFESAGVVGEATALLGAKIKAGNFLVKVQEVRLKQEAAARKSERSAFSDQLSAAGRQTAAFAEEAIGVGQTGFERQSTCPPAAQTTAAGAEGRDDAVAEESRGVDQARPAKAGTPTSRAVAEESRGVDQGRPAKAGTLTSATGAEESRGVQRRPAQAGTPTSRAVAEESRGVDQRRRGQARTSASGKELLS